MTQEQINQLAFKYSKDMTKDIDYKIMCEGEKIAAMRAYEKEALKFLKWLLRDHLIVEKSRVMDEYDTAVSTQHSDNYDTARYSQTIRYHLEDLFGEETFNQDEQ